MQALRCCAQTLLNRGADGGSQNVLRCVLFVIESQHPIAHPNTVATEDKHGIATSPLFEAHVLSAHPVVQYAQYVQYEAAPKYGVERQGIRDHRRRARSQHNERA